MGFFLFLFTQSRNLSSQFSGLVGFAGFLAHFWRNFSQMLGFLAGFAGVLSPQNLPPAGHFFLMLWLSCDCFSLEMP